MKEIGWMRGYKDNKGGKRALCREGDGDRGGKKHRCGTSLVR